MIVYNTGIFYFKKAASAVSPSARPHTAAHRDYSGLVSVSPILANVPQQIYIECYSDIFGLYMKGQLQEPQNIPTPIVAIVNLS